MKKLLQKAPIISSRSISSIQDSLVLDQLIHIYEQKDEFDLAKLSKTLERVLRNDDAFTIFPMSRKHQNDSVTLYRLIGSDESNQRLTDIIELIDYLLNTYKKNKSINKTVSPFSELFVVNNDAMELRIELLNSGIDVLTESGEQEISDFFWSYEIHCGIVAL